MTHFIIGKIPDKSLIEAFEALDVKFGRSDWSFTAGSTDFSDSLETIKGRTVQSYSIQNAHISLAEGGIFVRFRRTPQNKPDAYFDEIYFENRHNQSPTSEQLISVEEVLREHINFPNFAAYGRGEKKMVGLLEREISSIADIHKKLLSDTMALKSELEANDLKRRADFEKEQKAAAAKLQKEEAQSLEKIAKEREELQDKIKQFDFSDHMRARRQLREQITTQVQGFIREPARTRQSQLKFYMMFVICISGMVAAAGLAWASFQSFVTLAQDSQETARALAESIANSLRTQEEQATPQTPAFVGNSQIAYLLWMLALRGAVLSAVSVGFAAYLVSMLRKSYDSEVQTLQELQRYGMDINRASWVIETAMEMTTKESATLPEDWIKGACAGLFQNGSRKDGEVSSLAALGAVMGLGPEVNIGPTGATFKVPPKGTKKAANEADKAR